MAVPHATTGDVINLCELLDEVETHHSRALVKTDTFEAMLVQVAKGATMDTDTAPAPLIAQGISGKVRFAVNGAERDLGPNDWMYLERDAPETITALEDSTFLLTVLFVNR